MGSGIAIAVCLGCYCYYAFFKKPDEFGNRRINYEEKNGPIDLEMIQLRRKRQQIDDGTVGSSLSESENEYYMRNQQ